MSIHNYFTSKELILRFPVQPNQNRVIRSDHNCERLLFQLKGIEDRFPIRVESVKKSSSTKYQSLKVKPTASKPQIAEKN